MIVGVSLTKHFTIIAVLIAGVALVSGALILGAFGEGSQAKNRIGSGVDDWWTVYPAHSSAAGSIASHPQWILDALEQKPVMIYVHKGCSYCLPQTEAMAEVVNEYKDELFYYDISAEGQDARAMQAVTAYDPNGGVSYVPLTAIVTLAPDTDGKVQVVWHSSEQVTGKAWIEEYARDAISYHNQNSGNWKKPVAQRSVYHGHI